MVDTFEATTSCVPHHMRGSLSGLYSTSIRSQHLLTTQAQPSLWVIRLLQYTSLPARGIRNR